MTAPQLTIASSRNFFDTPVRVSMTAAAGHSIAAVTAVELPRVGSYVEAGARCGAVESGTGSVALFSPVGGRVTILNEAVLGNPDLIAADPEGVGWLFAVLPTR